jgi:hypothetical protein
LRTLLLVMLLLLVLLRHLRHWRPVLGLRVLKVLLVERADAVGPVLGVFRFHDLVWRQGAEADRKTTVIRLRDAQTSRPFILSLIQMRRPVHIPASWLVHVELSVAVRWRR